MWADESAYGDEYNVTEAINVSLWFMQVSASGMSALLIAGATAAFIVAGAYWVLARRVG